MIWKNKSKNVKLQQFVKGFKIFVKQCYAIV